MFNFSNNNGKLLAISGKARHGKDTFTNILIEEYKKTNNFPCFKVSFADTIKQIAIKMFPTTKEIDLWGNSENRSNPLYLFDKQVIKNNKTLENRDILLDIGEFGRSYHENLWGMITLNIVDNLFKQNKFCNIIITDCRRKNEMNLIKNAGGVIIRIFRPNVKYIVDDISDTDLDDVPINVFDRFITNDSIDTLRQEAAFVINEYMLKQQNING